MRVLPKILDGPEWELHERRAFRLFEVLEIWVANSLISFLTHSPSRFVTPFRAFYVPSASKWNVGMSWMRSAQELALGVYGPVTTRSQLYLALVASWQQNFGVWKTAKYPGLNKNMCQVAFSLMFNMLNHLNGFACFLWLCGHMILQDFEICCPPFR